MGTWFEHTMSGWSHYPYDTGDEILRDADADFISSCWHSFTTMECVTTFPTCPRVADQLISWGVSRRSCSGLLTVFLLTLLAQSAYTAIRYSDPYALRQL
jgi:hypothetical protein